MNQKNRIIGKIKELPDDTLNDLEKHIDNLFQNNNKKPRNKCSTEKLLKKLKPKSELDSNDLQKLTENFRKEWDIIKEEQIITKYFIDIIRDFQNPTTEPMSLKRTKIGSSTGVYFENIFGEFLNRYLRSKDELYTQDNYFKEIKISPNPSLSVSGERNQKEPDILIKDCKTNTEICIIELKKSYTHRSVKKEYNTRFELWKKLNNDIKFLYVIFHATSENKTRTYKKEENCRVICYDFRTDKKSQEKNITPTIVDSIETIFEEIYNTITDFKKIS